MISNIEKDVIKKTLVLFCCKKVSTILKGIASKHHGCFYCLNCLHSFATKTKLKSHEKVRKKKDFCRVVFPTQKMIY